MKQWYQREGIKQHTNSCLIITQESAMDADKKESVTPVNPTVNQEEKKETTVTKKSEKKEGLLVCPVIRECYNKRKVLDIVVLLHHSQDPGSTKNYGSSINQEVDEGKCYSNTSRVLMKEQESVLQNTTVMVKTSLDKACNDLQQNYTEEITAPIEIKENYEVKGKGLEHFGVELEDMKDEDETDNQQTVYAQPNFEEFLKSSHEEMKKRKKEEKKKKGHIQAL
uniref:Uncharacterized protein n=1 Tax=Tanacetum cinerariifolium TaxID=118510 RepID=A0A6L2NYM0_TANCI|nr:hypothetical protein [Tanacetum cinerariifolium]